MSRIRRVSCSTLGLAAALLVGPVLVPARQNVPQPRPSPNAPDQSYPQGMNGPGPKDPDAKVLDKQNQVEVRAQVEKLYALVFELREEVKQTNGNTTLSLSVVKKAQQIEKLAKEIKDRAKN